MPHRKLLFVNLLLDFLKQVLKNALIFCFVKFFPELSRNTGKLGDHIFCFICACFNFFRAWMGQIFLIGNGNNVTFSPLTSFDLGCLIWILQCDFFTEISFHVNELAISNVFVFSITSSPIRKLPKNAVEKQAQKQILFILHHVLEKIFFLSCLSFLNDIALDVPSYIYLFQSTVNFLHPLLTFLQVI